MFESFEGTSSNNFEEFINNIYTSQNLIIDHYDLSKELKLNLKKMFKKEEK